MNNKLVEEVDDILHDLDHGNITRGDAKAKLLLAMNAEVEEPLAVLADRKGHHIVVSRLDAMWFITMVENGDGKEVCKIEDVVEATYALAEAKARQYLEGLPDVGMKDTIKTSHVTVQWHKLEPGHKTCFGGFVWLIKAAFWYYFKNEVVTIIPTNGPTTEQGKEER